MRKSKGEKHDGFSVFIQDMITMKKRQYFHAQGCALQTIS